MAISATKNRLGGRLAVCQAAGTVVGISIAAIVGFLLSPPTSPYTGSYGGDFTMVLAVAFMVGIPFYAAAVLVLHTFTKSILAHPFIWCVMTPAVVLAVTMAAFPPISYQGIYWVTLIAFCALLTGVFFFWWQVKIPLAYVR